MSELASKKCVPCEGGTLPLPAVAIEEYQQKLGTPWDLVDNKKIKREFKFEDFAFAMAFVNKVAQIAENEGHHPDIHIFYNKVTIELWTHAIGGLSTNDFIVAAKIEAL